MNDQLSAIRYYLRQDSLPTPWCPGCGNGIVLKSVCDSFEKLKFSKENTVVVSGIGCSGRSAGIFDLDSVHTAHGRAIPVAEGIKMANNCLNVIVLSGDGDLLGIGGNHLMHASRRNTDITVICFSNEIYGMTGGQVAPTTRRGTKTLTTPEGSKDKAIDFQPLIKAQGCFYAKSTVYHVKHLEQCIVEALKYKGFSYVDVKVQCITNNGRRLGFKNAYEMLLQFKENYSINDRPESLEQEDIGITKCI